MDTFVKVSFVNRVCLLNLTMTIPPMINKQIKSITTIPKPNMIIVLIFICLLYVKELQETKIRKHVVLVKRWDQKCGDRQNRTVIVGASSRYLDHVGNISKRTVRILTVVPMQGLEPRLNA